MGEVLHGVNFLGRRKHKKKGAIKNEHPLGIKIIS
jgi:hypothetical protein